MKFRLTHELPKKCLVAVSGGVDSVSALHWLNRKSDRVEGVIHVNHNTGAFAESAQKTVEHLCEKLRLPLHLRKLDRRPEEGHSPENWWREQRYRFFKEVSAVNGNLSVVVAHNMDDCLEEYLMCTLVRGFVGTIPYAHGPCIRPFRLWKRESIESFARKENLCWNEDPSNLYTHKYKRAYIRYKMSPLAKELNPGIYNLVERAISDQDKRDEVLNEGVEHAISTLRCAARWPT